MSSPYVTCPECGRRPQRLKGRSGGSRNAPPAEKTPMQIPRQALIIGGVVLLVALLGLAAWRFLGGSGGASGGTITASSYVFRLSGSNTVGKSLAPDLVKAWLESKNASDIRIEQRQVEGKDAPETVIQAVLNGETIAIEVRPHGTSTAFEDIKDGTADIGMASRAIKGKEADELKDLGDMRAASSEHVLGLDGVAVIVNADNSVGALSTATLRRIFTGQVRDWAEIGGQAGPISVYARDDKSGTFDTFKSLVLRDDKLGEAKRFEDSAALEAAVANDAGGIGFVALPYIKTTRALAVNDGDSAPLQPTSFSIRTESYPLTRRLYFYSSPQLTKREAKDFITFALSPAGQAVVRKAQFVDLDIVSAGTASPQVTGNVPCQLSSRYTGDANAYCNLRRNAEALPTTFRFLAGQDELDTRATADIRRVLTRMEQTPNKQIVLAGFSDSLGDYAGNCALSAARAKRVGDALRTLGLPPAEIIGFCSELPVRDNATPEGRDQNRRVEIFLR